MHIIKRQTPFRQAFTLIETVVVIAVIAILVTLTAMAMVGLQTPGSRQGAMLQITQALEEGRMTAIEKSTKIYVGIADATHPDEEKRQCALLLFREYTADEIAAMSEPPGPNVYKPLTDWNLLPKGYFVCADIMDTLLDDPQIKIPVAGLPGNPESVYAIAFGSLGQVVKPEQASLRPLVVMRAESVAPTGVLKRRADSEGSAFCIQVNRFTGRVKSYDGLPLSETSDPE